MDGRTFIKAAVIAPEETEPMLSHYHTLLKYLGWKDCGTVVAAGMWPAGAVNDTEYSRMAYKLGREST